MNLTQEKSLLHLTGKKDPSMSTVESWENLVNAYPYFIPARFFLAARLKQTGDSYAGPQIVKTNLYFTNSYWLQFLLEQNEVIRYQDTETSYTETVADETEPTGETFNPISGTDGSTNKIAGILSEQLAEFKKPVDADAKLEIDANEERAHTIDYFASQGIKIDLSKIPQDKLTTHLRKFTDWLKQMKNADPLSADLGTSNEMEKAVAEIARISNVNREVVTEAMAEVLVKQGQVEKAIQLFIKLSFINPEKTSYFAARIEQLKGI